MYDGILIAFARHSVACVLANGWRGMVGGSGYCGVWVWLGAVAFARIYRRTYASCAEMMGEAWGGSVFYG
jgi:hypothetical protein